MDCVLQNRTQNNTVNSQAQPCILNIWSGLYIEQIGNGLCMRELDMGLYLKYGLMLRTATHILIC